MRPISLERPRVNDLSAVLLEWVESRSRGNKGALREMGWKVCGADPLVFRGDDVRLTWQ